MAFARGEWNKALGKIKVKPMDDAQRQIFYTSLYHSMIAPSVSAMRPAPKDIPFFRFGMPTAQPSALYPH